MLYFIVTDNHQEMTKEFLVYTKTYDIDKFIETDFNLDICINSGKILEAVSELLPLFLIGESPEPIVIANKITDFDVYLNPDDNQEYIFETEIIKSSDNRQVQSFSLTFGKIQYFTTEKQRIFIDQRSKILDQISLT